jgi:membrane associated rhomboid family serine protease
MGRKILRILVVFLAIGALFAMTGDSVPAWAHLTVLAGGIWVAFRLWDEDPGGRGGRGR